MLKSLKPNSFWSLPFHSSLSSSLCLQVPSFLLFSLLNCKYQVPFILFCYFCYYCYYIVVLVIFFSFPPVEWRSSVRAIILSRSLYIRFHFSPWFRRGKQNKTFHFYSLSLNFSLQSGLFSPHKCCHNCFIYCSFFCLFF